MRHRTLLISIACLLFTITLSRAQVSFSANDTVPSYRSGFRFGTNLGAPKGSWSDQTQATLASGSATHGVAGAGCNSLRLSLPHKFLEQWGYNIRTSTQKFFCDSLGMSELVVFLGGPADISKSNQTFCTSSGASKLFADMYEPIWDNGENGTPVNDNNDMALYVYKMVSAYGERVRYWEVINEPDYTSSDKGWQSAESADNWWKRDPAPCELDNLLCPVQYYVRALRIAYEVIKFLNPDDFVCIGGIGYDSFLDAVLRNSDNPDDGKVSADYPLKGGAYFDCLSYHSYPMYGTREWLNGTWVQQRHSDKAVEVLLSSKTSKQHVLAQYGYDGETYPVKRTIITETNVPHTQFDSHIGSETAQRNYLVKAIINGQAEGIDQIHTFCLSDGENPTNSYGAMGFYRYLGNVAPFNQQGHPSALACRTAMSLLAGYSYSDELTQQMYIPENIDGAAFANRTGKRLYVLWAKTKNDLSENASAVYTFPDYSQSGGYYQYDWDYAQSNKRQSITGSSVALTGSPSFFEPQIQTSSAVGYVKRSSAPVPFSIHADHRGITFAKETGYTGSARVHDCRGRIVGVIDGTAYANMQSVRLNLVSGVYVVTVGKGKERWRGVVVVK